MHLCSEEKESVITFYSKAHGLKGTRPIFTSHGNVPIRICWILCVK